MRPYIQKIVQDAAPLALFLQKRLSWQQVEAQFSDENLPEAQKKRADDFTDYFSSYQRQWWPVPIHTDARRGGTPRNVECFIQNAKMKNSICEVGVLLEHAGAHANAWSSERVLSAGAVPFFAGERIPRRASAAEWDEIAANFLSAAQKVSVENLPLGLSVDDDTILHALISRRLNPELEGDVLSNAENAIRFLVKLVEKMLKIDAELTLFLCIDDLCPGGNDALFGLVLMRRLQKIGVHKFVLSTGSRGFSLLMQRDLQVETGALQKNKALLAPVLRAQKNSDVEVSAAGPFEAKALRELLDDDNVKELAGLVFWDRK